MRRMYGLERWRKRSKRQLREHPLCAKCLAKGLVVAAKIADHVVPHKGDPTLFWEGDLQSLCARCHNSTKALEEFHGYSSDIDADGWPTDPAHPANSGRVGPHRKPW